MRSEAFSSHNNSGRRTGRTITAMLAFAAFVALAFVASNHYTHTQSEPTTQAQATRVIIFQEDFNHQEDFENDDRITPLIDYYRDNADHPTTGVKHWFGWADPTVTDETPAGIPSTNVDGGVFAVRNTANLPGFPNSRNLNTSSDPATLTFENINVCGYGTLADGASNSLMTTTLKIATNTGQWDNNDTPVQWTGSVLVRYRYGDQAYQNAIGFADTSRTSTFGHLSKIPDGQLNGQPSNGRWEGMSGSSGNNRAIASWDRTATGNFPYRQDLCDSLDVQIAIASASPRRFMAVDNLTIEARPLGGICSRHSSIQTAITDSDAVPDSTACADVTEAQINAITGSLNLSNSGISALLASDLQYFTGLDGTLNLSNNSIKELPTGIFNDLTAVTQLDLQDNGLLYALPTGLFNNMTALRFLRLEGNDLKPDDIPTTGLFTASHTDLRSVTMDHEAVPDFFEISLDNSQYTGPVADPVAFAIEFPEDFLRNPSNSNQHVRFMHTNSRIATEDWITDYNHADPSRPAIDVSIGRQSATFTADDDAVFDSPVIICLPEYTGDGFTAGTQVVIRADSGTSTDWEPLRVPSAAILPDKFETGYACGLASKLGKFDVAGAPNICDRTQAVIDAILAEVTDTACETVTIADIAEITSLSFESDAITSLQSDDFANLSALTSLTISGNSGLTALPDNIFGGLVSLTDLDLSDNALTTLPDNVFGELISLTNLDITENDIASTAVPSDSFVVSNALETLAIDRGSIPENFNVEIAGAPAIVVNIPDDSFPATAATGAFVRWSVGEVPNAAPGTSTLLPSPTSVRVAISTEASGTITTYDLDFSENVNVCIPSRDSDEQSVIRRDTTDSSATWGFIYRPNPNDLPTALQTDHVCAVTTKIGDFSLVQGLPPNRMPTRDTDSLDFDKMEDFTDGDDFTALEDHFTDADLDNVFTFNIVLDDGTLVTEHTSDIAEYSIDSDNNLDITAIENAYGTETINIRATDSRGDAAPNLPIMVDITAVNDDPPTAVSATVVYMANDTETKTLELTDYFTDPDENQPTYRFKSGGTTELNSRIAMYRISGSTLTVTSIDAENGGEEDIVIEAVDADDSTLTAEFTLDVTITERNDPPTATADPLTFSEDEDWTAAEIDLDPHFVDRENDDTMTFVFTGSGDPRYTTLIAMYTISGSTLTIVPVANANGEETIEIRAIDASDMSLTVTKDLSVNITAVPDGPQPTTEPSPDPYDENFHPPKTIDLDDHFNDPEGDAITYVFAGDRSTSITATARYEISGSTLTITSIIGNDGTDNVGILATSAGPLTGEKNIRFTINDTNTTPAATGATFEFNRAEDWTADPGMDAIDLGVHFTDADTSDTLTFIFEANQAENLTTSVASYAINNANDTLTVTSIENANGDESIVIRATDNKRGYITKTLSVSITPAPDPPTATPDAFEETFQEDFADMTFDLNDHFSDPDGDTLTFTVTGGTGGLVTLSISGSTLTISSIPNQQGDDTFDITAADAGGATTAATKRLSVTVTEVNDPPTPSAAPLTFERDEDWTANPTEDRVDLSTHFTDPEGDTVSFLFDSNGDTSLMEDANIASYAISGNILTVTPKPDGSGTETIPIRATDDGTGTPSNTKDLVVTINPLPDAPRATTAEFAFNRSQDFGPDELQLTHHLIDPDDEALTFVFDDDGSTMKTTDLAIYEIDNVNDVIIFTHIDHRHGSEDIVIRATDPTDRTATKTLTVTIMDTPDSPQPTPGTIIIAGEEDFPQQTFDLMDHFSDGDGFGTLTFTLTAGGQTDLSSYTGRLATYSVSGSTLTVTAVEDANNTEDGGAETVTIKASDPTSNSATKTITVSLTPVEDSPKATAEPFTFNEEQDFTTPGTLLLNVYFTDPEDDPITYVFDADGSTQFDGEHASYSISGSTLTVTAIADQYGQEDIVIRATDTGSGMSFTRPLMVNIAFVNSRPVTTTAAFVFNEDEEFNPRSINLNQHFTDPDAGLPGHTLTFVFHDTGTTATKNTGLAIYEIDGSTLRIRSIIDANDDENNGPDMIVIRATDNAGASITKTLTVSIKDTPEIPLGSRIVRIEPRVNSVTVRAGQRVRLELNIFGDTTIEETDEEVLDNSLADGIEFDWDTSGGSVSNNTRAPRYTVPDTAGSYTVTATLHRRFCFGPTEDCTATFNVNVRRSSTTAPDGATPTPTPVPRDPSGPIPSILSDNQGDQYEVFTPVRGGSIEGDGHSLQIPPGAVPDNEFIGLSVVVTEPADNTGVTHHRYTLAGETYTIEAVDSSGAPVEEYRLNRPATTCIPLPENLRGNVQEISLVKLGETMEDALTVLTSRVTLTSNGETRVCGSITTFPATIAVGQRGAPSSLAELLPTPDVDSPDTGAAAPSSRGILFIMLIGAVAVAAGALIVTSNYPAARRARRDS